MKYVGKSYPIHDALAKVTGTCKYAADMELPNMTYMAVLFSPIASGIVKKINTEQALALDGVICVLHPFNTTDKLFNRYRTVAEQDVIEDERIFTDQPRFVGDRIAAVVAESKTIAQEAVALLDVEYHELPYALNIQEVLAAKNTHQLGIIYNDYHREVGDKNKIIPKASQITTTSRLSRISHIAMENHACVADYNKNTGELTIYSPNQSVFSIRTLVADLFDLHYNKIRVVKTTMGGSFGCKQEWITEPVAAAAALAVGRPVKLVFDRKDNIPSTICRCPLDATMTSIITDNGKIQSVTLDATFDAGAYIGNTQAYIEAMAYKFTRNYKYPYLNYTGRAICTNSPVSGAYRGWTSPEFAIIMEHNLNVAAKRLNIDPIDLRLENTYNIKDTDIITGLPINQSCLKDALELGRQKFDWKNRLAKAYESNGRYLIGIGMAAGGHVNGYYPRKADFGCCTLRMSEDGSVSLNISLHDHGCGTVRLFQMIVGESLDIPPEMVQIKEADTGVTPFDMGCFSSRTTYVLGRTALNCTEKLKAKLVEQAARLIKIEPADLIAVKGKVYCWKDTSIAMTYTEIAKGSQKTLQEEIMVTEHYINTTNPAVHGVHFAQVQIDTYTGMVKVTDYLAVHDIGTAINPEICRAQVQGAVQMGIGAALSEEVTLKPDGRATNSLKDYHLINAYDMPQVNVIFIEKGNTEGPFGAKSIGEIAYVPVTAAVIAAVNNGLDSEVCELPLNPNRILQIISGGK